MQHIEAKILPDSRLIPKRPESWVIFYPTERSDGSYDWDGYGPFFKYANALNRAKQQPYSVIAHIPGED